VKDYTGYNYIKDYLGYNQAEIEDEFKVDDEKIENLYELHPEFQKIQEQDQLEK
jgi:hypothetical protein